MSANEGAPNRLIVTTADAAGESRFEERELTFAERNFAPPAAPIALSEPEPSTALTFVSLPIGWDDVAHPSPRRQTLVGIAGTVRVTTSDGAARDIGPGCIWRMEDTHGSGHHTRVVGDAPYLAAIVQHE